jgi:hypothetical protein
MYDPWHAMLDYASNCLTLCTDLLCMGEIVKIAYSWSWKSMTISWMRNGEGIRVYISNTTVWIYMLGIASLKRWNHIPLQYVLL